MLGENDSGPVSMPNSCGIDFTSSINGRDYRLMIGLPDAVPPKSGFPTLVCLDGAANFWTAAQTMRTQSTFGEAVEPGVIVAVSYPTTDLRTLLRQRYNDMTLPAPPENMTEDDLYFGALNGGMDRFIDVIAGEVLPIVHRRYPTDKDRQSFFGHSLGGLTVVRTLFTRPALFQDYIASSPSLHWGEKAVLKEQQALVSYLETCKQKPRVRITAGEFENDGMYKMVDNVNDLSGVFPGMLGADQIESQIFEGEDHDSVVPAALSRAVRFAFKRFCSIPKK